MQDTKSEKSAFRAECRRARAGISSEIRALLSEQICERLLACEEYKTATLILAYHPIGSEADTLPIIKRALADKKRLALPICRYDSDDMDFFFINDLDSLDTGRFSIPSPSPLSEKYDPLCDSSTAIILLPALAFDKSGKRIGYGRGFYDKYLTLFGGKRIGLQFSSLVFDSIPSEAHDMAVDMIISDKEVIRI